MAIEIKSVKPGERLSYTSYFEVVNSDAKKGILEVKDTSGQVLSIQGKDFIESNIKSASQFKKTEKLGKNALAEKLFTSGDSVMQVEFLKQDGTPRTLIGYFTSQDVNLGRSNMVDLEVTTGHNMRQVDHRTIKSVIVNQVKYVSK
jgi:hypothetical protein